MAAENVTLRLAVDGVGAFKSKLKDAARAVKAVGDSEKSVAQEAAAMGRSLTRVQRLAAGSVRGAFKALGATVRSTGSAMVWAGKQAGSALKSAGGMALRYGKWAAAGAATAVAGFGVMGIRAAAAQQQSELAFTTMLGDAGKAKAFLQDLQGFARTTPFDLPGITDSAQRLLAMGFASKDVLPTLTAVGDAAAGLGGGQETLDGITMALGQMKAKGKITSEEMMQLTERGVPAWEMLAKSMGVSVSDAMEQVTKGTVKADQGIAALTKGMNKKFGGLMEKQAGTISGLWSNLKDTATQAAVDFVKPFLPQMQKGMKRLGEIMDSQGFKDGLATVQRAIATTVAFIIRVLTSPQLKQGWDGIVTGVKAAITWLRGTRPHLVAFGQWFRQYVFPIGVGVGKAFQIMWRIAQPIITRLVPIVQSIVGVIRRVVEGVSLLIQGEWSKAFGRFAQAVGNAVNAIATVIRGTLGVALNVIKEVIGWIGDLIGKLESAILKVQSLKSVLPGQESFSGDVRAVSELSRSPGTLSGSGMIGVRATGGIIQPKERATLVGENGPEVLSLPAGSKVSPIQRPETPGSRTNEPLVVEQPIHVYLDGREIWRAMKRWQGYGEARA